MAVGAGTLLAIAAISAIGTAAASGAQSYYGSQSSDRALAKQEKLQRDKMSQEGRMHRDNLRQRKDESEYSKIGTGLNTLSGLAGLRQNIGSSKASQKILY